MTTNSGGTVIKGNFADSGTGGRNTLNIDGTIKGSNSNAVNAVNMDVNISTTGKVKTPSLSIPVQSKIKVLLANNYD